MICSLFDFYPHSAQSGRHEGVLMGFDPPKKAPRPKLKHKALQISGVFVHFLNVKPQSALIENFLAMFLSQK